MSEVMTSHDSSDQDHQAISPYLRRPLRSLNDYLRELARPRGRPEATAPADREKPREGKEHDGPADQEGRDEGNQ